MQDTTLTRRAIHPNDTHNGESSGASHLTPSKDPFKLGLPTLPELQMEARILDHMEFLASIGVEKIDRRKLAEMAIEKADAFVAIFKPRKE